MRKLVLMMVLLMLCMGVFAQEKKDVPKPDPNVVQMDETSVKQINDLNKYAGDLQREMEKLNLQLRLIVANYREVNGLKSTEWDFSVETMSFKRKVATPTPKTQEK